MVPFTTVVVLSVALPGLFAQEPLARFDAPVVVSDHLHRFERTLDLDGDGLQDAVGWWWAFGGVSDVTVTGWINDGTGRLVEAWDLVIALGGPSYSVPRDLEVGDLDGDGNDDFVVAFGQSAWLYTSNGAAPPSLYATHASAKNMESILVADWDGDGLDDLAYLDVDQVWLQLNQGAGQPLQFGDSFATLSTDYELRPLRANADATTDILVVNGTRIYLYHVREGAYLGLTVLIHTLGPGDPYVVAGDVDGDLDDDVVAFLDGDYQLFRRTGPNAVFSAGPVSVGGPATDLFDVTGDGILDGVCCGGGGGGPPVNIYPAQYEIAVNDGTGAFAPSFAIPSLGAHHLAGVSDLDGDGDADLVAGRCVLYAEGPLTGPRPDAGAVEIEPRHLSDRDGDGDPDLLYGIAGVLDNSGDGSFLSQPVPAPPAPGVDTRWDGPGHPGDFDGDGDVDLLVSLVSGNVSYPTVEQVHLLENNGSGMLFDAGPAAPPGVNMNAVTWSVWMDDPRTGFVADADADGDLDFLARSIANPDKTAVWWNDGSGQFTAGPVFDGELVIGVAHLNADAHPDLVMAADWLAVRYGLGGQQFGNPAVLPDSDSAQFSDVFAVDDLDGDGDVDVAGVNRNEGLLVVHFNDGAGTTFTTDTTTFGHFAFRDDNAERRVFAVDVDGDGLKDLVASGLEYSLGASLVLRRLPGQAGWDAPLVQVFEATSFADVDGDGDLDALGDEVMLNRTHVLPGSGFRRQYGAGAAGTGGVVPRLGAAGPFRQGETAELRITGVPPGKLCMFTVGFEQSDIPDLGWGGNTGYAWPWAFWFFLVTQGPGEVAGDGSITLPYVVTPTIAGIPRVYHQAYFDDPGHYSGITSTNGLVLDYEPAR